MRSGTIVPRSELSPGDIRRMYELMSRHYDGLSPEKFLHDLSEKDGCLFVRDEIGAIQGFSTYLVFHKTGAAGLYRVLFSGDTIVDARSWGRLSTLHTLGRLFADLLAEADDPLYWCLLSKGVRTYLLLPLLFRRFCPGGGLAEASRELAVLRDFATRRYGCEFDPATSIVRPVVAADRLKPEWAFVSEARRAHPHVAYFLAHNPGHELGEELVSVAAVTPDNLTDAGRRLVLAGD
jgi:hypothetical protein